MKRTKRRGKARVLTSNEFRTLVKRAACDPIYGIRDVTMLWLSFGLGLRVKEIAALKMSDVVGRNGQLLTDINLTPDMTKGEHPRHVYVTNEKLRAVLKEYVKWRYVWDFSRGLTTKPTAPLFKSTKGGGFDRKTLQMRFTRVFRRAGFPDATSHSGRRTFATRLINKGVDIVAVSKLMGHASVQMTARYVADNPIRLRNICANAI